MLRDRKTLAAQSSADVRPEVSAKGSRMSSMATPRSNLHEDRLAGVHLPGDVKERLQVQPELPAKKRPAGDSWQPFKSEDRMGMVAADDSVGKERAVLPLNNFGRSPSYDNVNGENQACTQSMLRTNGAVMGKGPIVEHFTDEGNETLYEEVEDSETGNKGLLYRNNIFSRY